MVAIRKVIGFLEAQRPGDRLVILLIVQHPLASGACAGHLIISGSDEISGVAFLNELGYRAACKQRNIIGVWLNGS